MIVPFAGVIIGQEELDAVTAVAQFPWLTHGEIGDQFEKEFAKYIGARYALLVNSGSSANMLALAGLDLPKGAGVIVAGGGFPATLNPILHLGLKPIVVDLDRETHQIDLDQVEEACRVDSKDRPMAIIFAHTLGIPVDMQRMMVIAKVYNLKVVEDCCEALGTQATGGVIQDEFGEVGLSTKMVGSFGDTATFSFYPSHQMTALGGGGMVVTSDREIALRMKSMREWGKRQLEPGFEGDYRTEFTSKIGDLPYARSYIYDTVGWNFKYPDANAAHGLEQLRRMIREDWTTLRARNYSLIHNQLEQYEFLETPTVPVGARPSYFGYCVTVKEGSPFSRDEIVQFLESKEVRCRPFFAGNILRQPAYDSLGWDLVKLPISDYLMRNSFFFGVWPGLNADHMKYVADCFEEFCNAKTKV